MVRSRATRGKRPYRRFTFQIGERRPNYDSNQVKTQYPLAARALQDLIHRKQIRRGALLPATKVLAPELGFTPVVIQKACQVLVARGVLDRVGYKLIVRVDEPVRSLQRPVHVVAYQSAFGEIAGRLLTERGISHRVIQASYVQYPRLAPLWTEIMAQKPGGIILGHPAPDPEGRNLIRSAGVPVVVCGSEYGMSDASASLDVYRGTEAALRHLTELGHKHIADVASFEYGHQELAECYRLVCHKLKIRCAAPSIWRPKVSSVEALGETMRLRHRQYPGVTALYCDVKVGLLATQLFRVPDELSVVSWGDLGTAESRPALTTIELGDPECLARWACAEIISQMEAIDFRGPRPKATHAFFTPRLVLRESTRASANREVVPRPIPGPTPSMFAPAETWHKVYPHLKRLSSTEWLPLDLSRLANHSLTRRNGWLGAEPLEHFPPGLRSIHGVPFQILDEERNEGRAVITFRSPHAHSSKGKLLPVQARLRLNSRVKALYFLHGCGWASPSPFAEYRIYYRRGDYYSTILQPLGLSGRNARKSVNGHCPNVQDWWPGNRQIHFPHAHYVTIFDPADPTIYERTLYSLEWINPRPEEDVKFIQVRVDPRAGPTLALVAVTALL